MAERRLARAPSDSGMQARHTGLGSGVWHHQEEIAALWREAAGYQPRGGAEAEALYTQWRRAVERAKEWVTPGAIM